MCCSAQRSRDATLIIVSDHGFRNIKHKIHPNVLLKKHGLLSEGAGLSKGDAWVLPEGGTAGVYITNSARKAELVSELRSILTDVEGINHVYSVGGLSQGRVAGAGSERSSTRPRPRRRARLYVQQRD